MSKLTYIDDCQLDHFILKRIISRFGSSCEVKCTDTCNEVLNLLSQYRLDREKLPDIILLDIYLPEFDAWDFLDNVQLMYPTLAKPVEIYILSACKYPEDVEHARHYPFVKAFILKPITKEVLQNLIRQKESEINRFTALEAQN
ncbi:MAG: response regulator [Mucilaginibacter sp.]